MTRIVAWSILAAIGFLAIGFSVGRISMHQEVEDSFDKGMKAGVEYQTWFCENEVVPLPLPTKE